eukprot:1147985-Pelagomonas_calceolata.AAC.3
MASRCEQRLIKTHPNSPFLHPYVPLHACSGSLLYFWVFCMFPRDQAALVRPGTQELQSTYGHAAPTYQGGQIYNP